MKSLHKKSLITLIISIALPLLAGFIGSLFTTPSIPTWYAGLLKPALNPPSWIFGPVWTTLFICMGVALFLVLSDDIRKKNVKIALGFSVFQLGLNVLWSYLFFGIHNPGLAFVDIVCLWLSILATLVLFSKISKTAAWLLVPYLAWVSFASYLNYMIWTLN